MLSNVRTFGVLVSFLLLSLLLPVCSQKIGATQSTVTPQATPVQNAPAQNTPVQNTSAQGKPADTQDLLIGGGDLLEVTATDQQILSGSWLPLRRCVLDRCVLGRCVLNRCSLRSDCRLRGPYFLAAYGQQKR